MELFGASLGFLAYVLAYGLAVVGCGAALARARGVTDDETRAGLVGLLLGSGGWALFELGFVVAPGRTLRYGAYVASLVVGLTTVGAWLYFCSAYTGRSFHRDPTYRRAAVVVYLAIVGVKLTNPLHGWYFTTEFVTVPFAHLTINHEPFHWVVSGLSYALVAVGFFMLYEMFLEADYDTRPLGALAATTALPVVLDLVGFTSPVLIDINYEPLGVAVFAVGVLYVFQERFLAVQLTDGVDEAVIYLGDDGVIHEFNDRAANLFPDLAGATGQPLSSALPDVAAALDSGDRVVERSPEDRQRYYLVSGTAFSLGGASVGRMVVATDVTETERRRRELERQNEQLEGFAAAIRHELLNTLQIISGHVSHAGESIDSGDVAAARSSMSKVSTATDRMSDVVDDLALLARQGQTLRQTDDVDVGTVAEAARDAAVPDLELAVDGAGEVQADATRLRELFESAFAFAEHNGADRVSVTVEEDAFSVADDGDPLDGADPERLFEYGTAVPDAQAGMLLANVRTLARVHGWETTVDADYEDGFRMVVSGVGTRPAAVAPGPDGPTA